jgi:hypothetical protein
MGTIRFLLRSDEVEREGLIGLGSAADKNVVKGHTIHTPYWGA